LEDRTIIKINNTTNKPEASQPVLEIWGGQPLSGEIKVSGAKNSALAILAGTLLCSDQCRLTNLPNLVDIGRMCEILSALGLKLERNGDILDIDATEISTSEAPYEIVSRLRASFFVLGPLLARLGVAKVPLPGGCAIGSRPIEIHIKGLQALGADVFIEHGVVHATVKGSKGRLKGTKIYLDYPSVGATETILMAATLAEGETIIENAACEPEVVDLANFCNSMGAKIKGAGTNTIVISGVDRLHCTDFPIIPDRIEAGTFLVAGAITRSAISVFPVIPDHLTPVIAKLQEIGCEIIAEDTHRLRIIPKELRGVDIETLPYPGFPTDMQAQFTALLSTCEGNSIVTETVFENRLHHVAELQRMGANIKLKGHNAIISGVHQLSGAPITGSDLRAAAAMVLAGLAADGKTLVSGLEHLDRGYENIEEKLRGLGAKIRRLDSLSQNPVLVGV
jgi:UDP-N-acetylglucosamine 1-carboxyvinyltransferase